MCHLPFLEALASVTDTSDPIWRDVTAGYLVLRFFDEWLAEGPPLVVEDPGLASLKTRIHDTPDVEPTVRDILLRAVDAMSNASQVNPGLVSQPLFEYGQYLQSADRMVLAAHVYEVLIDALDPQRHSGDPVDAALVYVQYGYVMRSLGQLDAAHEAYECAEALTQGAGAIALTLRARMGLANTVKARGNLREAEALLDHILADAIAAGIIRVQAWALHSRGAVKSLRGAAVEGIQDLLRAYELTDDRTEREFILGDIAASAACVGYQDIARNAYHALADTAQAPHVQSAALCNLLELAALNGDPVEFEQMFLRIQAHGRQHPLPVEHTVHAQLYTAYGIERFGTKTAAIEAYRTVMTLARDIGLHQVAFMAEQSLNALMLR